MARELRRIPLALALIVALAGCGAARSNAAADVEQGLAAYRAGDLPGANSHWSAAAALGSADAMFYLGVLANDGPRADAAVAVDWFRKAAEKGHAKAAYNLALAYERGLGVLRDRATAIRWLDKAAASKDPDAEHMLALLLLDDARAAADDKVRSDKTRAAIAWLQKAAEAGSARSQYMLGTLYLGGDIVTSDAAQARKWLARALKSGVVEALRPLLEVSQMPPLPDIGKLEADAKMGDPVAQHAFAAALATGRGIQADTEAAQAWLLKAAQAGLAEAQYDLGIALSRGEQPDYAGALRWLRLAASRHYARAEYALGQMYADGLGVTRDEREAFRWYQRAAGQQLPAAEYAMGYALSEGAGTARDDAEAFGWFKRAAMHGHAEAAFRVSTMYANGEGVAKDPNEIRRWECRASILGSERAAGNLDRRGGIEGACEQYSEDLADFAVQVLGGSKRRS